MQRLFVIAVVLMAAVASASTLDGFLEGDEWLAKDPFGGEAHEGAEWAIPKKEVTGTWCFERARACSDAGPAAGEATCPTVWGQCDAQWADEKIRDKTMCQEGCALAALGMGLSCAGVRVQSEGEWVDPDPHHFLAFMNRNRRMDSRGAFNMERGFQCGMGITHQVRYLAAESTSWSINPEKHREAAQQCLAGGEHRFVIAYTETYRHNTGADKKEHHFVYLTPPGKEAPQQPGKEAPPTSQPKDEPQDEGDAVIGDEVEDVPPKDDTPDQNTPDQNTPDQNTPDEEPEQELPQQGTPDQNTPDEEPEEELPQQGTPDQNTPDEEPEQELPQQGEPEGEVLESDPQDVPEDEPPVEPENDTPQQGGREVDVTPVEDMSGGAGTDGPAQQGEPEDEVGEEEEADEEPCLADAEPCAPGDYSPTCLRRLCSRLSNASDEWRVTLQLAKDCESGKSVRAMVDECNERKKEKRATVKKLEGEIKGLVKAIEDLDDQEAKLRKEQARNQKNINRLETTLAARNDNKTAILMQVEHWTSEIESARVSLVRIEERMTLLVTEQRTTLVNWGKNKSKYVREMHRVTNAIEQELRDFFPMLEPVLEDGHKTTTTEVDVKRSAAELTIEAQSDKTETTEKN